MPEEYHLIAKMVKIECKITSNIPQLNLIEKTYGPFISNQIDKLPIFLALELKKKKKLNILLPFYLQSDYIIDIIEKEKTNEEIFQMIHPNFFELYFILKDFIPELTKSYALFNELRQIRLNKIKAGLKSLDNRALILENLTQFEFAHVKNFVIKSMEMLNKIENI